MSNLLQIVIREKNAIEWRKTRIIKQNSKTFTSQFLDKLWTWNFEHILIEAYTIDYIRYQVDNDPIWKL